MDRYGAEFREKLKQSVAEIESGTGAEIVVALVPAARSYLRANLITALAFGYLVFTFLMFIPVPIWDVGIFLETTGAFIAGFFLPMFIPPLKRFLSGKRNMQENAEILARSMFQKGRIYETRNRTGVLILFSFLEKEVVIIADRRITDLVPVLKLEQLEKDLERCFYDSKPWETIPGAIKKHGVIFTEYVPRTSDDINELPDDLWIS